MRVSRHKLQKLNVQLNIHIKKPIVKDKENRLLFILHTFAVRLTVTVFSLEKLTAA